MKIRYLAAYAAAALLTTISNASATIIHVIYDMGITVHGTDGAGLLVHRVQTTLARQCIWISGLIPRRRTITCSRRARSCVENSGTAATITVNGHSFTLYGNHDAYDTYSIGGSPCSATACTHMSQRVVDTKGYVWANAQGGPIPLSLQVPHVMTADYLRRKGMNG